MLRVLQCVSPRGVDSNVFTMTASTCSSVMRRGVPGRGSSSRPSTRSSMNRCRHLPTVPGATRRRRATAVFVTPSAQASTMRARRATKLAVRLRCASDCNCCRSSSVTLTVALGRPVRIGPPHQDYTTAAQNIFHLFLLQDTRYVLYSYCPIWYGGLFNVPRLVVQLACTATLGWAVYVRLVGSAPPPGLPRVLLLVGVLVLAALVVVSVILMRLMSLS